MSHLYIYIYINIFILGNVYTEGSLYEGISISGVISGFPYIGGPLCKGLCKGFVIHGALDTCIYRLERTCSYTCTEKNGSGPSKTDHGQVDIGHGSYTCERARTDGQLHTAQGSPV